VSDGLLIQGAQLEVLLKTVPPECAAHGPIKDVLDLTYVHLPAQELWVSIFIGVAPEQLFLVFRNQDEAVLLCSVAEMKFNSREAIAQETECP
jgi:hypothetical protein